jgi:Uma2 family endonuclease
MALPERQARLTPEQYLELERDSAVRHEFVNGVMHAMGGASSRHNRVAINIVGRLVQAAQDLECRLYASDMKLRTDHAFYYPDVMAVCAQVLPDEYFETHPCLLVEVLSPTTAGVDRREKLEVYRRLPSLETYLIVDQERRRVERHWRDARGEWWQEVLEGDGRFRLPCLGVDLDLEEIYRGL